MPNSSATRKISLKSWSWLRSRHCGRP
jgi:hypothetical protein